MLTNGIQEARSRSGGGAAPARGGKRKRYEDGANDEDAEDASCGTTSDSSGLPPLTPSSEEGVTAAL